MLNKAISFITSVLTALSLMAGGVRYYLLLVGRRRFYENIRPYRRKSVLQACDRSIDLCHGGVILCLKFRKLQRTE